MGWKKIAESKDLVVFEKALKDLKLKIEARKTEDTWEVFKTEIKQNEANLISEHFLENKNEVEKLIERLKREKYRPKNQYKYPIKISLKRILKEEFIEKWTFYIEDKNIKNFLYVKFDNDTYVDIVMHEKYKYSEESILAQIEYKLGLKDFSDAIQYEVFYYKKNISTKSGINPNYIDIEFSNY